MAVLDDPADVEQRGLGQAAILVAGKDGFVVVPE